MGWLDEVSDLTFLGFSGERQGCYDSFLFSIPFFGPWDLIGWLSLNSRLTWDGFLWFELG